MGTLGEGGVPGGPQAGTGPTCQGREMPPPRSCGHPGSLRLRKDPTAMNEKKGEGGEGGGRRALGTKQAAFPGAGSGLGPPPGRMGLGAHPRGLGEVGMGVGGRRRAGLGGPGPWPPCLLLCRPGRASSLQTFLSYTGFLLCPSCSQCSFGVEEADGAGGEGGDGAYLGKSPPRPLPSLEHSIVRGCPFPSWRTQALVPPGGPSPADSLHHHHH